MIDEMDFVVSSSSCCLPLRQPPPAACAGLLLTWPRHIRAAPAHLAHSAAARSPQRACCRQGVLWSEHQCQPPRPAANPKCAPPLGGMCWHATSPPTTTTPPPPAAVAADTAATCRGSAARAGRVLAATRARTAWCLLGPGGSMGTAGVCCFTAVSCTNRLKSGTRARVPAPPPPPFQHPPTPPPPPPPTLPTPPPPFKRTAVHCAHGPSGVGEQPRTLAPTDLRRRGLLLRVLQALPLARHSLWDLQAVGRWGWVPMSVRLQPAPGTCLMLPAWPPPTAHVAATPPPTPSTVRCSVQPALPCLRSLATPPTQLPLVLPKPALHPAQRQAGVCALRGVCPRERANSVPARSTGCGGQGRRDWLLRRDE